MENINLIQTKSKLTLSILGNIKNLSETERTNLPKSLLQKTYNLKVLGTELGLNLPLQEK